MQSLAALLTAFLCLVQPAAASLKRLRAHSGGVANRTTTLLTRAHPYYHTSDELLSRVKELAASCDGATLTTTRETKKGINIDVIAVKKDGVTAVNKMFILFGEHSRELISPESGLTFLEMLCGQAQPDGTATAEDVLSHTEFMIVLNANPHSRRKVEEGEYCLRVNENGVDLNRNWADKWQAPGEMDTPDTYPGSEPFSEPETQIFKELLEAYQPSTFLTVHSGTFGMYMPWAYDTIHMGTVNQKPMLDILQDVDERHCNCPFGAAGKEVGYACPGTCLDYAYDVVKVPFAFAFEIYTSPEYLLQLKRRWAEKQRTGGASLLSKGEHLGHAHFHELFGAHKSDFVHLSPLNLHAKTTQMPEEDSCFRMFNPATEDEFTSTTTNWASVYLEIAAQVTERLKANATSLSKASK